MGKPSGKDKQLELQDLALQQAKQTAAQQQKAYEFALPYYQKMAALMNAPGEFTSTPFAQSLAAGQLEPIDKEGLAALNNIIEGGAAAGQYGSGALAGPLANELGRRAGQRASVFQQLPLQGLNIGLQGLAGIQQQQQIANPLGWSQATSQATQAIPRGGFWDTLTGAFGSGLGSGLASFANPWGIGQTKENIYKKYT